MSVALDQYARDITAAITGEIMAALKGLNPVVPALDRCIGPRAGTFASHCIVP